MTNPLAALVIARAIVPETMPDRRRGTRAVAKEDPAQGTQDRRSERRPLRALRARRSTAS
ncbi:MAG: hypothetical protein ACXWXQ_06655 [Actinomycetota bacterium]